MDAIRGFVLQLTAAGILAAVVDTAAPERGAGKLVKLVSALFFMLVVLSPLSGLLGGAKPAFRVESAARIDTSTAEQAMQQALYAEIREKTAERAETELSAALGGTWEVSDVALKKTEDGNISIVRIVLCSSTGDSRAEELLRRMFGEDVEIAYGGEPEADF